jgi:hypothetical protein
MAKDLLKKVTAQAEFYPQISQMNKQNPSFNLRPSAKSADGSFANGFR